jgi:cysteine desulfurase
VRYFDHNATSPMCEAARAAWLEASERYPGNPSSPHRLGARAARALEEAREVIAGLLQASPDEIVWTSGATEGNNAVLHHAAQSGGEAWVSALEHPCVLAAVARWFPGRHRQIPVGRPGVVDVEWISAALQRADVPPALIAVMAANNETGVLQPWEEVLALCQEWQVPFLCDAAQWIGKLPASRLAEATFVTACAHKFGGPAGVGFLKCPSKFRALVVGGMQENGRRAGTENVAGARACARAMEDRAERLARLPPGSRALERDAFEARLVSGFPEVQVLGQGAPRLWNTSALMMPQQECRRRWVVRLDKLGFAVSTGSACASGREKPSHVLKAMGMDGTGDRLVRVSAGWETPGTDWAALAEAFLRVASEIREA